jgi:hypothetical protein
MALEFATGTLLVDTGVATTEYTVTGKTGTWKAVILYWSGRPETTDAAGETDIKPGLGVAVSSTSRWAITAQCDTGSAASVCDRGHTNAACVAVLDSAGAIVGLADFVAFTADGFTLVVDDAFPAALEVSYVLLGGADLTNVASGFINHGASTGDVDFSGVGFQPDFLLLGSAVIAADPPGVVNSSAARLSIGAATASAQAVLSNFAADLNDPTIDSSYCRAGEVYGSQSTSNTNVSGRASFTSFLADGFRINFLEGPGSSRSHYLCLKGGTYTVGDFLTATDTNAFTEAHGAATTPKGAMFFSANRAASTQDAATAHWEWSVGASDGTLNNCQYTRDKDAAGTSDSFTAVSHDECYLNGSNDAAQVIEGEGHVTSFDATNINLDMTDADPVQSFVWYAAFGDAPTVATPVIDPDGGEHEDSVEITLTCATGGAAIYYTTDGSAPDASDTLYTVPFTITVTSTVKAIGILAGYTNSAIDSADFTIVDLVGGSDGQSTGVRAMQYMYLLRSRSGKRPH